MKDLISNINKVFESRVRLGIMSVLMVNRSVDFKTMKKYLSISDGNLASHSAALEKEGFITIKKKFIGKRPNTSYSATEKGIKAFKEHLEALESLINVKFDS